jgi:peroxiredoxin
VRVTAKTLAEELAEICVMDAPLWQRLEAFVAAQRAHGSPFADASQILVDRLKAGDVGNGAPEVGETMPSFLLPDQKGRLVGLDDLIAEGPLVLSFNRGHWCPFCRIELSTLAQAHEEFAGLGARIVSVMPERQAYVGRLPRNIVDRLTIVSDIDNAYALSLGLTMWLGDELKHMMLAAGVSLEEAHGNADWFVPVPATFVLGTDGRVVARMVEPDFRRRMNIEDIRRALADAKSATE